MNRNIIKSIFAAAALLSAAGAWADTWTDPDTGYTWTYQINGDTAVIHKSVSSAAISPKPTVTVTIPASLGGKTVTSIGYAAFRGCSSLTSVIIPNNVTSIGDYAFSGCNGLTSVTIPDSVTSIGDYAFYNCVGLTSVTIPDSVTSIGWSAFSCCSGLEELTLPFVGGCRGNTGGSSSLFGYIFGGTSYTGGTRTSQRCAPSRAYDYYIPSKLQRVVITDETVFGYGAFDNCSGLTSVTIPDSVKSMGYCAFYNCINLTSVYITDIAKWCEISFGDLYANPLYYAKNLFLDGLLVAGDLTLPEGLTSIGTSTFCGCSGLTSVTIPDGVTSIGDAAFNGCSGLTSVTIPNSVTNIGYYAFSGCSGLTNVTIPNSVASIGSEAFNNCSGLTSVTMPNGVPRIEDRVFSGCSGLTNVTIPDSVTSIGYEAFCDCSGLASVTIPNRVTSIGEYAFRNCSGLTSVMIPNSVTSIGGAAFSGCSGLEELTLPFIGSQRGNTGNANSLFGYIFGTSSYTGGTATTQQYSYYNSKTYYMPTKLKKVVITDETVFGYGAFRGCSGLTSVSIPDSVTSIGDFVFFYCTGLTSVTIPDSVTNIGYSAFCDCYRLTNMTIPDNVTSIRTCAFYCTGLTSVTIPESVTCIGDSAFAWCSSLTSVTIPNSVTNVEASAFQGCSGLTNVHITDLAKWCGISFGDSYANPLYYAKNLFLNGSLLEGDLEIPDGVKRVPSCAFRGCRELTSVTIPNSVTSIGYGAFSGCSGLTSVMIPSSVTSIGEAAFSGCSGLTSVTIPNSVKSIGEAAFSGCSGLEEITLPFVGSQRGNTGNANSLIGYIFGTSSYAGGTATTQQYSYSNSNSYYMPTNLKKVVVTDETVFGYGAFYNCSGLTRVAIPNSVTNIGSSAFQYCRGLTSVSIPNSVTSIGDSAFSGCSGLTSVTIPSSVTSIGTSAFEYCHGLTSVTIPGSVTSIGTDVFYNCSGLASVTILDGVTSIGYQAFYCCSGLTSVTIPNSVMSIGYGAFYACNELIFDTSTISGVTLVDGWAVGTTKSLSGALGLTGVRGIGYGAFSGCSGLTNVTIPDSVTSIGGCAFEGCNGLTSVTIPDSVTSIGGCAFEGCNGLTSVTIPDSVTNIGYSAFRDCIGLTSVMIPNSVTSIGDYAFSGCSALITIYVSSGDTERVRDLVARSGFDVSGVTFIEVKCVSFAPNGGSVDEQNLQVAAGCAIGTLPMPVRVGYTFMGWFTAVSGGTQISEATTVTDDVTYYAHWTVNQYTVTFDANGGSGGKSVTQNYGTSLSAPTVMRTGYTFMGWSPSVPTTVPAANATYTAQWQVNQYTVTFEGNGGALGERALPRIVTTLDYGSAIVAPTVTREWFNFTGWSPAVAATVPAYNVTYTAQWARWGDTISASKMGGKTMRELYPSDYTRMTTVVLEEGITELPVGFFSGCNNVVNLTLPESLREFGIDDLPSKIRASLVYDENGFMIYGNWILDYQNRNASEVTIPEGIVGIGRGAFKEMFDLETVTMPESLRCIAKGAFEDCSWIQNLQFMSGLRYVGPEAFRGCSSLLGASFADGVEHIGANAFKDCWQMTSVRLPYTVAYIGDGAFTGCSAIRGVTVPTHLKTMQNLFPASYSQIGTAEVAEGETTVMDDMFKGCVALRGGATQTDMSMIPNTVTNIGARAFQGCTSLTAFVVPDSVVKIGASVFQGCSSLWNVTLSRSLTEIPDYAFYGCYMLETMVVPESVAYLGDRFFSGRTDPIQGQVIENALYYLCTNAPDYHSGAYAAIAGNMTTYVLQNSRSWDGRQGSRVLPQSWNGYDITYWTPNRFDVTFDANGGQFDSMGGSTWSEQQITDTTYALPSTEPVRPGWAFEGWWTEQTGGAEVRYTTVVTATRTHTIYAHWRSLGNKMTVTFNSNGGTVVTPGAQDYVPGQTFGQFPAPTRRGYTFQGWWTEAVNGIRMTEATQVPAADMELFAHWTPITYYVRFHANGGTGTMSDQPFTFDVSGALKTHAFTRTGFAFTGWATMPSGQVRYAENKTVVNLEEVDGHIVDLYAVWSGVGYSVRFDSNGGTGIMDNQTIAVGETQNLWPCAFARGGYTFAGWAVSPTDAEAKKVTYRDGQAVKNLATSNGATVPLYAVWVTGSQTVRITFDANGGSVAPNDYWDCVVGTAVEAFPTPTRPGFTFAGWWTARTGGTQVSSIARVTSAQTFYAHWTENGGVVPGDNSVTVTFNGNGGSVTETQRTVASGAAVGELPKPKRTGYIFSGWWTAAEGGIQVDPLYVVNSSITFYAHWISDANIVIETEASYMAESDGSFELVLGGLVLSGSTPKIALKGLPAGLKYDAKTGIISGKATKPGVYKVTVSATNATVKKPVTAEFEIVVPNLTTPMFEAAGLVTDGKYVFWAGVTPEGGAAVIDGDGGHAGRVTLPDVAKAIIGEGWTLKIAGLPSGLKYDAKTGKITGVATKAGTYTVTFTATNGKEKETATITLNVEALPTWATGTFVGNVKCKMENVKLEEVEIFGFATMTVAENGKISGKIALEGTNWTFSAASYAAVRRDGVIAPYQNGGEECFIVEAEAKAGKATMPVVLEVAACDGGGTDGGRGYPPAEGTPVATACAARSALGIRPQGGCPSRGAPALPNAVAGGMFGEGEVKMWRNMWKDKATANEAKATIAGFEGVYTVSIADGAAMCGSGYLSLTVGKNGDVKASGKLADGTGVSTTSPLVYDEDAGWLVMLYAAPSAYKGGSFAAAVGFEGHAGRVTLPSGPAQWTSRNPQATGDYGEGFDCEVNLVGAYYSKLDTLRKYYESVRLDLDGAPELDFTFKETSLNEQGKKVTTSSTATAEAVDTLLQPGLTATVNEKGAIVVAKATKPVQDKATKEWSYGGTNDGAMTLSFAQATGIFKGSYTFWYDYVSAYDETKAKDNETRAHTSKKVSFEGVLVQGKEPKMDGFYLWDAIGEYVDEKTEKTKTYKYKQSFPVRLFAE